MCEVMRLTGCEKLAPQTDELRVLQGDVLHTVVE